MRYYGIKILDEDGQLLVFNSRTGRFDTQGADSTGFTYTSYANGQTIPGALAIELDIMSYPFGIPGGNSWVRVWGISIGEIGQASDLTGKSIEVYGGMQKGLPLATAAFDDNQSGLLAQGIIFPAFGNWIGTDMTLDLIVQPGPGVGTNSAPVNIVVEWAAGTPMADALRNTLETALPGFEVEIRISEDLVLNNDETAFYRDMTQFAQWVKALSKNIIGGETYPGVDMAMLSRSMLVFDQTTEVEPKQIRFNDMVGQPTWIDAGVIQLTCMMRADVKLGDWIRLPQAVQPIISAPPQALVNYKSAFEGVFHVQSVRHTGQSRNPDATAWATLIDAVNPEIAPLVPPPA